MTTTRTTSNLSGFGFDSSESRHHFVLSVPQPGSDEPVSLAEVLPLPDGGDALASESRSAIDRYTWGRVAETVQRHFNTRLKDARRRTSRFTAGENPMAPFLGKELALLFWALEDQDSTDVPNVLSVWQGLAPEERWWLYSVAKTCGPEPGAGVAVRGWRRAVRIAFAESPAPGPADGGRGLVEEAPGLPIPADELGPMSTPTPPSSGRRRRAPTPPTPAPSLFDTDA